MQLLSLDFKIINGRYLPIFCQNKSKTKSHLF